jgi:aminoglycoside/choline kinase family phosphotransferase
MEKPTLSPEGLVFLDKHLPGHSTVFLAEDVSPRKYYRSTMPDGKTFVIMDSPFGDYFERFIGLQESLSRYGVRVPKIHHLDDEHGHMVLEDFGDLRLSVYLDQNPDDEKLIYGTLVDNLCEMANLPCQSVYDDEIFSTEGYENKASWFLRWNKKKFTSQQKKKFQEVIGQTLAKQKLQGRVFVHTDYHVDNILVVENKEKVFKFGIIDFQFGVLGSPVFDLMSLVDDARRELSPETREHVLSEFSKRTGYAREDIDTDIAIHGAIRNLKILGVFYRVTEIEGQQKYAVHIPRVKKYLEEYLKHPALARLKAWYENNS